ncbi:MAG: hypothetical protein R6X02_26985, partial [Enhygromyxa sp.]
AAPFTGKDNTMQANNDSNNNKVKKITKLFVDDLRRIRGGSAATKLDNPCPEITTLACGEETPWFCSAC